VAAIFAYLDAGSGSMIVQLLLGGFAAVVVTIKLWWRRLLRFLRLRPGGAGRERGEPDLRRLTRGARWPSTPGRFAIPTAGSTWQATASTAC